MQHRLMDYHTHTSFSFDGTQSMEELCLRMIALGVQEVCLTEHFEMGYTGEDAWMNNPPSWTAWMAEIQHMREKYPQLTLLAGVEIGDAPGFRAEMEAVLSSLPLDFRLLSLHLVDGIDPYESPAFFASRTRGQAYRAYAAAVADAATHWQDWDSLAHLGYVARYAPGEVIPLKWHHAPDEIDTALRAVIEKDRCLEVNASGFDTLGCPMPHESILRRYLELGGDKFTFGSDAHTVDRDHKDVERARELVASLGGRWQAGFAGRKRKVFEL